MGILYYAGLHNQIVIFFNKKECAIKCTIEFSVEKNPSKQLFDNVF